MKAEISFHGEAIAMTRYETAVRGGPSSVLIGIE